MNHKSKAMVGALVVGVLAISGLALSSCNRNQIHDNYRNYGNGYEAAQNGKPAPYFWSSNAEKKGYESGLSDLRCGNKPPLVEFKYTDEEIKSLENKWDTFEEMVTAAFKGDRDAMFAIGLCYLYGGKGLPIDVSKANMFFAKAASLGHAPSIEKMRALYIEDSPNPFLHNVYVNLAIAMGHTEYTMQYHCIRSKMVEKFGEHGKPLVEEIERIAQEKLSIIYENLDELEKDKDSQDSDAFFLKLNDITMMDHVYDLQHWLSIAEIK